MKTNRLKIAGIAMAALLMLVISKGEEWQAFSRFSHTSDAGSCDLDNPEEAECGGCYVRIHYTEICTDGGPQECGTVPYSGDPGSAGGSGYVDAPSTCVLGFFGWNCICQK